MPRQISLCLLFVTLAGCKSAGIGPSMAAKLPGPSESIAAASPPAATESSPAFSIRRAMELVGFSPSEEAAGAGLVPNELTQLTSTLNTILAGASELNASDPPHVTAQKARALMDSLRPWDTALAAAQSLGLVDETTAKPLQLIAGQMRVQAEHLIQFGSDPRSIEAIKQLAQQLAGMLPRSGGTS